LHRLSLHSRRPQTDVALQDAGGDGDDNEDEYVDPEMLAPRPRLRHYVVAGCRARRRQDVSGAWAAFESALYHVDPNEPLCLGPEVARGVVLVHCEAAFLALQADSISAGLNHLQRARQGLARLASSPHKSRNPLMHMFMTLLTRIFFQLGATYVALTDVASRPEHGEALALAALVPLVLYHRAAPTGAPESNARAWLCVAVAQCARLLCTNRSTVVLEAVPADQVHLLRLMGIEGNASLTDAASDIPIMMLAR
jgi:hypothetical protein